MGVCSETKPTLLAGYIITIVALVIHLIGFATPYWYDIETKIYKYYFGLWQYCVTTLLTAKTCDSTGKNVILKVDLTGTQAAECISFILFVAAVVCLTIRMFALKDKDILIQVASGLCIAAGVFALIGVVIFGIKEKYNDHLNYSFAFCVIGGIAGIIAGAVPVVAKYKS